MFFVTSMPLIQDERFVYQLKDSYFKHILNRTSKDIKQHPNKENDIQHSKDLTFLQSKKGGSSFLVERLFAGFTFIAWQAKQIQ
jgi:hypothetical protein